MKAVLPAVLLLTVSFAVIPSIESVQPILDEDIEDVYELIEEFIEPLLEYNDFSIDDLPYHLEYLIAKYYLVFTSTEAVQSLDTLEQMLNDYNHVNDYNKINNSLKKVADDFPEYIEHFNILNLMGDEKALETFVDDLLPYFDFRLRVVNRRDAVKLLVYREAYPDIMQIVGTAVTVFCDEFWNDVINDDGADPILLYRVLVGFHGRIYVVKHMISHLVSYFLPPGPTILDDNSMLDYLDDLKDLLEANSYRLWRFIKLPAYKMMTDEWIAIVEAFLRDLLTFIPLAELSSFIDEVALNPNNRQAMIAVRYDREKSRRENRQLLHTDDSDATSSAAENIWDVLNGIRKFVFDAAAIVPDVLHDIVTGEHQFSEDTFLEYVNDVLVPYNMSTEDVSQELRSIVSRYFNRVDPVNKGQPLNDSEMKILESNVLLIRTYLEKVRDAIGNVPDPSEAHHIEFDGLLQYMVNKFGGSIFVMEKDFVNLFNSVREYRDSEQFVEDHVDNLMNRLYTLDSTFQLTGKKPSELLSERLSSLKELIDLFVEISTF